MKNVKIGKNVQIMETALIGDNVIIEDDVYIDHRAIIRDNVHIKKGTYIGSNCIIGEYLVNFFQNYEKTKHTVIIGENSLIRSGTIIYGNNNIGDNFQTGHNVTIRENCEIGRNVSLGTLSDIQGYCHIGNYVRAHSNVHIGQKTYINDYVWIFPYVVFTNDPTPPSNELVGVTVESFAIISTGSIILPGVHIAKDSLIAAGANVTKNVNEYEVVGGNPAKVISDVRNIKNKITGANVYPWRYTFKRGMPWEDSDYESWLKNLNI